MTQRKASLEIARCEMLPQPSLYITNICYANERLVLEAYGIIGFVPCHVIGSCHPASQRLADFTSSAHCGDGSRLITGSILLQHSAEENLQFEQEYPFQLHRDNILLGLLYKGSLPYHGRKLRQDCQSHSYFKTAILVNTLLIPSKYLGALMISPKVMSSPGGQYTAM